MPTQTFFNLSEEKRKRFMDAVYAELSCVPFAEASINRIIQRAGISRGSFYQYFENKRDMLNYLLSDLRRTVADRAMESLRQSGGDLFRMFLDILDCTHELAAGRENGAFFRNFLSDLRISAEFLGPPAGSPFGGAMEALAPHVNLDALDIREEQDFEDMLAVLLPLTGEAFARTLLNPEAFEEGRARYAARLELIKRGFLKEKKAG